MKKGFTLIELLVVIAIIAILAAILFPVFAQAREKARQTSCLSNCKQIGTAIQLYTDDYDECLPRDLAYQQNGAWVNQSWDSFYSKIVPSNWATTYPGGAWERYIWDWAAAQTVWSWMDQTFPYVKNLNMYICPSGPKTKCYYHADPANFPNVLANGLPGYGYNVRMQDRNLYDPSAISMSDIKHPSELVFVGDSPYLSNNKKAAKCTGPFAFHNGIGWASDAPDSGYQWNTDKGLKHNKGANFVFCDGHAKYFKKNQGPCEYDASKGMDAVGRNSKYWDYTSDK